MDFVKLLSSLSLEEEQPVSVAEASGEHFLRTYSADINGIGTEVVYGEYVDRVVCLASHFEKLGSCYAVARERPIAEDQQSVFTTRHVFGVDTVEIAAAARFLAQQLDVHKPLVLFLCLRDYSPDMLKAILAVIRQ